MRNQFSRSQWNNALKKDPGLLGVSPLDAAKWLAITEQEVGELMLNGALNASDICENGEVVETIIPERDIQRYAITRRSKYPD